jgi:probable H4MPT-linked C1 transfer pathway protein
MPSNVLGFDIGGAHIKVAHTDGTATQRSFALWKQPRRLTAELTALRRMAPLHDLIAITMTGELCDCYASKRDGVHAILRAVQRMADETPVRVWTTHGRFVSLSEAKHEWLAVAAANWMATACWVGKLVPHGAALIADTGSTTTDLTPLWNGQPMPRGRTDPERLKSGELVYTGVRRTPVCALLSEGLAAEIFATTLDVYLLLEKWPENPEDRNTADGRPATRAMAHARLARMLGGDPEMIRTEEVLHLARTVAEIQQERIRRAAQRVVTILPEPPRYLVTVGSGEFLAASLCDVDWGPGKPERISIAERFGPATSQAACAYAIAVLASEALA